VARGGPANKAAPQLAGQNVNVPATREQRLVGVVTPASKPKVTPEIVPEQTVLAGQISQAASASTHFSSEVSHDSRSG
jgi:hypothetical protein